MTIHPPRFGWRLALFVLTFSPLVGTSKATPLLPDIFPWADQARNYMYGGELNNTAVQNKAIYRFTGALANIGAGPLELREVTHPNLIQDVYQRIKQSDGTFTETMIGSFQKPPSTPYGHLYLPGIAQYNLRQVVGESGVGPIVSSHDKTSYGLVDSVAYTPDPDDGLPPRPSGSPATRVYTSTYAQALGVSVGWVDLYSRTFPGQWVDATGLADGTYWLEEIFDPYNLIQESNETNNITRILVTLTNIPEPLILPGDYNNDGSVGAADYTVWRNTLGSTLPLSQYGTGADGDGDGWISAADYPVWKEHYGDTASGAGTLLNLVPEPSNLTALALVLMWLAIFPGAVSRPVERTQ
jgi:hypothetical protein